MIEPARLISHNCCSESASDLQTLLLEACRYIGEPDSMYGACSTHATDDTVRLLLYEHEDQWHKSLSEFNCCLGEGSVLRGGLVVCVHKGGEGRFLFSRYS